MELEENHLVAYLILGFKSMVKDYIEGKNTSILDTIKLALKCVESTVDTDIKFINKAPLDIKITFKQFSDCTSISFSHPSLHYLETNKDRFDHELVIALRALREFQIELLEADIYIRGGLSLGFHYENENILLSRFN